MKCIKCGQLYNECTCKIKSGKYVGKQKPKPKNNASKKVVEK